MKSSTPLLSLVFCLLLAGCGSLQTTSISQQNQNPLTASRYADELADTLANIIIQKDPILKESGMQSRIEGEISKAKDAGNAARDLMADGMSGPWISVKQTVAGYVLTLGDTLYLSSDFETDPGPTLHLYLTQTVDPRDSTFPDATTVDLGTIQTVYGAAEYRLPHFEKPELYRTAVLYDRTLKRIFGFAQLSKQPGVGGTPMMSE